VNTMGLRLALAAYNAADRPAGPEPIISMSTGQPSLREAILLVIISKD
jgi:hypothetical protein